MRYYFAPMEGLTDSIYRRLHAKYFPGPDRYYTPFLSPTVHRKLTAKEQREIPPADSLGYIAVPQLLTKNPEDFLWMAQQCCDLGYQQINLNLGCPSGTVTAKGKGSGMLADPQHLTQFLEAIFSKAPLPISIKTRLGFYSNEEFPHLLDIFNRFPVCELTIHPRVRNDFYKGSVDRACFSYAADNANMPLCYNGNIVNLSQVQDIESAFPNVSAVMIGRGLIANPGMITPGGTDPKVLEAFHAELLEAYTKVFGSHRNAMFRLKENWRYLSCLFEGGERLYKRLRKATDLQEYRAITNDFFRLPVASELKADW